MPVVISRRGLNDRASGKFLTDISPLFNLVSEPRENVDVISASTPVSGHRSPFADFTRCVGRTMTSRLDASCDIYRTTDRRAFA